MVGIISLLWGKLICHICRKRIRQWHDYRSQSTADGFRKNLFRIDASGFAGIGAINLTIHHRENGPASKTRAKSIRVSFPEGQGRSKVRSVRDYEHVRAVSRMTKFIDHKYTTRSFRALQEGRAHEIDFDLFSATYFVQRRVHKWSRFDFT